MKELQEQGVEVKEDEEQGVSEKQKCKTCKMQNMLNAKMQKCKIKKLKTLCKNFPFLAQVKFLEITELLVAAGYFRARIKGLPPFDKVLTSVSV